MVVLAVPFSPRTNTPPTSGETVVKIKASAMSSEPTTAENGNVRTSHPSCGYPRPRHVWVGPAYAGRDDDRRGRRPDFPVLANDAEMPGSQWRDRSGLAPDSSAVAASMMSYPGRSRAVCSAGPIRERSVRTQPLAPG